MGTPNPWAGILDSIQREKGERQLSPSIALPPSWSGHKPSCFWCPGFPTTMDQPCPSKLWSQINPFSLMGGSTASWSPLPLLIVSEPPGKGQVSRHPPPLHLCILLSPYPPTPHPPPPHTQFSSDFHRLPNGAKTQKTEPLTVSRLLFGSNF